MNYREECEASTGAHKLTLMINSWPKVPILSEQSKDFEGSFDLERSLIALKNLQEATRMMSRVRQNLELDLAHEEVGFGSARSFSNCIEELKKVVRESSYGRNFGYVSTDDERASTSRSLRLSAVQPKRAKSSNLVAKLMGLECIPSDTGRKCLVQSDTPSSIETLKARMLRPTEKNPEISRNAPKGVVQTATSKGLSENQAIGDHKKMSHSSPHHRNFYVYEYVPPVAVLKTRQSQAKVDKIYDRKKVPVTDTAIKQCEKRETKPLQNRKAQQQQERMSSSAKKRENGARNAPMRESKAAVKAKKAIPAPKSQSKLSNKRVVTTNTKLDSRESIDTLKKKRETKSARKSMDIIQVTGNTMYNDVRGIDRSRHALPLDERTNSKQCNRGHRRRDLKLFCETEAEHFRCEDIKLLLWSSQSFINYAQQLCGRNEYQTTYCRAKCMAEDAKVLLGCAKELVIRKSRQLERSNHPITTSTRMSRSLSVVTLDRLVEEIANEVEKLRARRKVREGVSSRDVMRVTIERDLTCGNVLVNAMWDEGWQEWICVEEADCVVGTVERLILCCLVEELVLDFKKGW